jgi:hypothetical protein
VTHDHARYVFLLFVIVLCFYGGLYALWAFDQHGMYFSVLRSLGTEPWDRPFADVTAVLSWGECHRLGFDVLRVNPCDPLNRLLNYSPLLLELPLRARDSTLVGLAQDSAFLIAAPFVLRPRSMGELAVAITAGLSTATIFALERGNLDVSIFVLLALSGLLDMRVRTGRMFSYALYGLGGAMKVYPFALLLTVARERPRKALALGTLAALLIGAFAAYYRAEFETIAHLLPRIGHAGSDTYGAYILPLGAAFYLSWPPARNLVFVLLIAGLGAYSLRLAGQIRSISPEADWSHVNFHFLLVGSIVLAGCFFTQTNMTYRVVFALFLLPGLFDLRNRAVAERLKRVFTIAIGLILWCMWREMFKFWLDRGLSAIDPVHPESAWWHVPAVAYYVGRELIWWWLVSVMTAIILAFLLSSPSLRKHDGG